MARGVTFTRESAERIRDSVLKTEGLRTQPLRYRNAGGRGGDGYRTLVCKTTEAATEGAFATCEIWDGATVDAYTATGQTIEVYFRLGPADSGAWVYVLESIRGYEAINIACTD